MSTRQRKLLLLSCILLLISSSIITQYSSGQIKAVAKKDSVNSTATKTPAPKKEVPRKVEMIVTPAPEPIPALKYELLPNWLNQTPGNAALLYYAAVAKLPEENRDEMLDKLYEWRKVPIEELPKEEVESTLMNFSPALYQVKPATLREKCDWELPVRSKGISLQLPPVANFRNLGKVLTMQARLQIAEGKYEEAIETMRQGFSLSRHIADGPTVICGLVGMSTAGLFLNQVEDFVQQPSSPNLYWALSSLPSPFINMKRGLDWEREVVFIEFPQLRDLENKTLTTEQSRELYMNTNCRLSLILGDNEDIYLLKSLVATMKLYPQAKEFLVSQGRDIKKVDALPVGQVVLIYQVQQYKDIRDHIFKWFNMPYWQARPFLEKADRGGNIDHNRVFMNPFLQMMPNLTRVHYLFTKVERKIAILRCVETVRMYAADNRGQLPASLHDIPQVVAPIDPLTGKYFTYRVEGNKAIIESLAPPDEKPNDGLIYEITIK